MPYEYCSAKLFPQDSKYNLCNFSFFSMRHKGCNNIIETLRTCGIEAVVDKTKNVSCDDNDNNVCYINELCSVRVINSTYNKLKKSDLINNKCERLIKLLQKVTDGHSHILK